MTSPNAVPGPADREPDAHAPVAPAPAPQAGEPAPPVGEPVLPEQSREDTDAGWGEYQERDEDRLYRDRPPHWADY